MLDLFLVVLFIVYRNHKILKASQLPILWIILGSMCAGSIRIIASYLSGFSVTPSICLLRYWSGHISFIGLVALLFMNLRVFTIVNAGLKKVKFPVQRVIYYTFGVSGVMVLYMALVSGLDKQIVVETSTVAITGQQTFYYDCQSGHMASDAVLYACEGVILLLNGLLCWKTRMVPGIINKSKVMHPSNTPHQCPLSYTP